MRENRPYGSEGGESGSTGLPYPYRLGSGWLDLARYFRNTSPKMVSGR